MNIVIIGAGTMGLTYATAFLRAHVTTPEKLTLLERDQARVDELRERIDARVTMEADTCIPDSNLLILAVKPQDFKSTLAALDPHLNDNQLLLSIMAGITIEQLSGVSCCNKVMRAMPNVPALVGRGMTVYTCTPEVTRSEISILQNLLATTGKALYVESEKMIDAATAISGSGPAYVYYTMQSMMNEAIALGFSESEAELLVVQTFAGSLDLYESSSATCEDWIKRVSSRGGTTEAALTNMRSSGVDKHFRAGVRAAYDRAQELGK